MALDRFLRLAKDLEDRENQPRGRRDDEPEEPNHDESNWLVSYADMMTLLCGFFIMLFSMAKLDEPQFERVKESVAKQFGGDYISPNKELAKFVTQMINEDGLEKDTVVRADHLGVSITFQSTLFFDSLSAELRPEGKSTLEHLIGVIANRQYMDLKAYKVVVEGHTDSRPITDGVFPSNWELSSARASRVVRLFIEKGFLPDHLTAIGYGSYHPEMTERLSDGTYDPVALAKNRRVVVRILDPKLDSIPFPDTAKKLAEIYGPPEPATAK